MFANPLEKLKGKEVEVRANGFDYVGKLIEVTEDYLLLRRSQGFFQVGMQSVQSVKEAGKKKSRRTSRAVDSSFIAQLEKDKKKKE